MRFSANGHRLLPRHIDRLRWVVVPARALKRPHVGSRPSESNQMAELCHWIDLFWCVRRIASFTVIVRRERWDGSRADGVGTALGVTRAHSFDEGTRPRDGTVRRSHRTGRRGRRRARETTVESDVHRLHQVVVRVPSGANISFPVIPRRR